MAEEEKAKIPCPVCEGTGGSGEGPERVLCARCNGSGVVFAGDTAEPSDTPSEPTGTPSVPSEPPAAPPTDPPV
jgi:hypothetical protein